MWTRLPVRVWPPRLRELWTVQLAQSKIFTISIELQHVESYEDNQLKVLKPVFCVFLGSNLNLECHIKLIDLGFQVFVCIAGTMANSLIAVVTVSLDGIACT